MQWPSLFQVRDMLPIMVDLFLSINLTNELVSSAVAAHTAGPHVTT